MRTTVMEVNLNKFKRNIDQIQKYIGNKKIMPVIKANGYGTYINKNIDAINKFDIVAVAILDEAIDLRKLGYKNQILILNQPYIEDLEDIVNYDITIGLSLDSFIDKIDKNVKVHLEIETGMNRTGIKLEQIPQFINKIKQNKNIKVEGIYTHLSSADCDQDYTNMQLNLFREAVDIIKKEFSDIKYIHSSASNGLLNYNDDVANFVRPGIIMYGYKSCNNTIDIEPICKLKTKITFLKEIKKGESISYSRKFVAEKDMKVATIPIGYADGLRRELFNAGEVVINGKKAKIVGTICMDSCMIDVTDIPDIEVGTNVYIWDNEIITLDEIAQKTNTINYEILSTISYRVPRIYIDK